MKCQRLEVDYKISEHEINQVDLWGYTVDEKNLNEIELSYCIRYRPLGLSEWILDRWWWNDLGLWTEDWIFNDWII